MNARASFLRIGTVLLVVAALIPRVGAEPADKDKALADLRSLDPKVRSQAAQIIRENHLYHTTPREKWDEMAKGLKLDMPAKEVLDLLRKAGAKVGLGPIDEMKHNAIYGYRLDDSWMIHCAINGGTLTQWQIEEEPREVFVYPPDGYTGFWRMYRINGERMLMVNYDKGIDRGVVSY